jgi:serine/threonine protein phosphatase 1
MENKFIVIGDIHGCLLQLNEILETTKVYSDHRIVFLGDYIDRGPDPEGVINTIKKYDAIFLLGNHEEMLIERYHRADIKYQKNLLLQASISTESLYWLNERLIEKYESDDYIFVHAGLDKSKSLIEQEKREYLWTRESGNYYTLTNKIVVHGHTIIDKPEQIGNRININTGCGSNGYLSALILPEMKYYNSSISPGKQHDWVRILADLQKELEEFEDFGTLEEV